MVWRAVKAMPLSNVTLIRHRLQTAIEGFVLLATSETSSESFAGVCDRAQKEARDIAARDEAWWRENVARPLAAMGVCREPGCGVRQRAGELDALEPFDAAALLCAQARLLDAAAMTVRAQTQPLEGARAAVEFLRSLPRDGDGPGWERLMQRSHRHRACTHPDLPTIAEHACAVRALAGTVTPAPRRPRVAVFAAWELLVRVEGLVNASLHAARLGAMLKDHTAHADYAEQAGERAGGGVAAGRVRLVLADSAVGGAVPCETLPQRQPPDDAGTEAASAFAHELPLADRRWLAAEPANCTAAAGEGAVVGCFTGDDLTDCLTMLAAMAAGSGAVLWIGTKPAPPAAALALAGRRQLERSPPCLESPLIVPSPSPASGGHIDEVRRLRDRLVGGHREAAEGASWHRDLEQFLRRTAKDEEDAAPPLTPQPPYRTQPGGRHSAKYAGYAPALAAAAQRELVRKQATPTVPPRYAALQRQMAAQRAAVRGWPAPPRRASAAVGRRLLETGGWAVGVAAVAADPARRDRAWLPELQTLLKKRRFRVRLLNSTDGGWWETVADAAVLFAMEPLPWLAAMRSGSVLVHLRPHGTPFSRAVAYAALCLGVGVRLAAFRPDPDTLPGGADPRSTPLTLRPGDLRRLVLHAATARVAEVAPPPLVPLDASPGSPRPTPPPQRHQPAAVKDLWWIDPAAEAPSSLQSHVRVIGAKTRYDAEYQVLENVGIEMPEPPADGGASGDLPGWSGAADGSAVVHLFGPGVRRDPDLEHFTDVAMHLRRRVVGTRLHAQQASSRTMCSGWVRRTVWVHYERQPTNLAHALSDNALPLTLSALQLGVPRRADRGLLVLPRVATAASLGVYLDAPVHRWLTQRLFSFTGNFSDLSWAGLLHGRRKQPLTCFRSLVWGLPARAWTNTFHHGLQYTRFSVVPQLRGAVLRSLGGGDGVLPPGCAAAAPRVLYMSRASSASTGVGRRVSNHVQLLAVLTTGPAEVHHCCSGGSFEDQFKAVRAADVILGPHGAGLAWVVFARAGTLLFQLGPRRLTHYEQSLFERFAVLASADYADSVTLTPRRWVFPTDELRSRLRLRPPLNRTADPLGNAKTADDKNRVPMWRSDFAMSVPEMMLVTQYITSWWAGARRRCPVQA
eukprot:TRINITY_DN6939_c0_g1_i1.p1 TRINITY_DN6939_c0_g1~~TRINITY_DN6939_c0_g1_i1.p1  ORF type:complete len:1137 (+),score=316.08 TRINITY_DN6939_c0_g1_i1:549-3959(+)